MQLGNVCALWRGNAAQRLEPVGNALRRFAQALDRHLDVSLGDAGAELWLTSAFSANALMSQLSATVMNVRRRSCELNSMPVAFLHGVDERARVLDVSAAAVARGTRTWRRPARAAPPACRAPRPSSG